MLSKFFLLALALGVASAEQCGSPAVHSTAAKRNLLDVLAGKSNGRIIGGIEATPHSFPWQVALVRSSGSLFCGGSIISENFVVSAAHCCDGQIASQVNVKVGAHSLRNAGPNTKSYRVKSIHVHPSYNRRTLFSDICLLELTDSIVYNEHVSPVCLGDATDGVADQVCTVSGWGSTQQRDNGDIFPPPPIMPDLLQQVDLPVLDQEACKKIYGTRWNGVGITSEMICGYEARKSGCNGDSGGPFVCQSAPGAPFKLVGVVSGGLGCADSTGVSPSVFSRTFAAHDWIARIAKI